MPRRARESRSRGFFLDLEGEELDHPVLLDLLTLVAKVARSLEGPVKGSGMFRQPMFQRKSAVKQLTRQSNPEDPEHNEQRCRRSQGPKREGSPSRG